MSGWYRLRLVDDPSIPLYQGGITKDGRKKHGGEAKRHRTEQSSEPGLRPATFSLPSSLHPPPPPPRPTGSSAGSSAQQARTMPLQARDLNILLPRQPHVGGMHDYAIGALPPLPHAPKPSSLVSRGQQQRRQHRGPLVAGAGVAAVDRLLHHQRRPHQMGDPRAGGLSCPRGPPSTSRSRGGAFQGLLPMPPLQCGCGGAAAQACPHRKCCRCCPGAGCQRHAATA